MTDREGSVDSGRCPAVEGGGSGDGSGQGPFAGERRAAARDLVIDKADVLVPLAPVTTL